MFTDAWGPNGALLWVVCVRQRFSQGTSCFILSTSVHSYAFGFHLPQLRSKRGLKMWDIVSSKLSNLSNHIDWSQSERLAVGDEDQRRTLQAEDGDMMKLWAAGSMSSALARRLQTSTAWAIFLLLRKAGCQTIIWLYELSVRQMLRTKSRLSFSPLNRQHRR